MNELNDTVKIAVLRILSDIVKADNVVHEKEMSYLNEVAHSFNLPESYKADVEQLVTLQALSIVRALPIEAKTRIAQLMGQMIVVDRDINYNEVKLYDMVCESCDIAKDFNPDNYPECTLSGAFVNPEDL